GDPRQRASGRTVHDAHWSASRAVPCRRVTSISRTQLGRTPRTAVCARTAGRDPRRRPGDAHRRARTPVGTKDPSRRGARLPLPVRARAPGIAGEHLAGPAPIAHAAPRSTICCRVSTIGLLSNIFLAGTADAAYVMDPEHGRILEANDAGCTLLGYTRAELLETPVSKIHPAEVAELSELLQRVLDSQRASTIKLTCRTKQGVFLPTEISLHAVTFDGRLRILGLVQDRSEHRASWPDD